MQTLPLIAVNGVVGAHVSPLDRGFAYGDGVFETCKIQQAKIPLWALHRERLLTSCEKLGIPVEPNLIEAHIKNLISIVTPSVIESAVIKITVTRGQGGRGYRLPDDATPTIVVGVFPATNYPQTYFSDGVTARVCHQRLSCNSSLAGLKHLNRLEQILARAEWQEDSIAEGFMLNTKDNLIEAVFSNVFLVKNDELFTPDLSEAGVAGVMRRFILETLAPRAGITTHVKNLGLDDLLVADEVFLCNSLYGIWRVKEIVHERTHLFEKNAISDKLQNLLREPFLSIAPLFVISD